MIDYVCTMGPSIYNEEMIVSLYEKGLRTIRFNMSHIDYDIEKVLGMLDNIYRKYGYEIKTMLDTRGPEIRLKISKNTNVNTGDIITLGKDFLLSVIYDKLKIGDVLQIDDGKVTLKIISINSNEYFCQVLNGGELKNKAGVYIKEINESLPFLSLQDEDDIRLAFKLNLDWIAASFTSSKDDIEKIREIKKGYPEAKTKIMAKVETRLAVLNIEEILKVSDGIMIGRGDLGVAFPIAALGSIQEYLIARVLDTDKELVVGTGFLKSMKKNNLPERAEVNDLYNTFKMGVRSIMFSGETAISKDPLRILDMANEIYLSNKSVYSRVLKLEENYKK